MAPLRLVIGLVVETALVVVLVATSLAQEPVRVSGWVQWVAGNRMQVMTSSGSSIAVDLTEADQSSYLTLRGGDPVIVDGTIAPDRRRVIADVIWRDTGRGWTQSP